MFKQNKRGSIDLSVNALVMITLGIIVVMLGIFLVIKMMDILPSDKQELSAPILLKTNVFPDKGQIGAIFRIETSAPAGGDDSFIDVMVEINGESLQLFDDGAHGDEAAGDGIFANTWDSSNAQKTGKIRGILSASGSSSGTIKNYFYIEVSGNFCREILSNGNSDDKIDVVVLGQGYSNLNELNEKAAEYLDLGAAENGIFSFSPFLEEKNRFNLYIINKSFSFDDLKCKVGCKGVNSLVCCEDKKVFRAAADCPYDYAIVLLNNESFCGSASSYAKACTGGVKNNPMVLVHEFGHIFGGLGDEYSYGAYANMKKIKNYNFPNCVSDCAKWPVGVEAGCIAGCGYSEYFRSTGTDSIMYTYVPKFNPVSIYYLNKKISKYSAVSSEGENNLPAPEFGSENGSEKKYVSELSLSEGVFGFEGVYAMPGKTADRLTVETGYEAKIVSSSGEVLYSTLFEIPEIEFPLFENGSSDMPPAFVEDSVNYTLVLPLYDAARKVEIYDLNGNKALEFNVDYLSKSQVCTEQNCGISSTPSSKNKTLVVILLVFLAIAVIYYIIRFVRQRKTRRAIAYKYYNPSS